MHVTWSPPPSGRSRYAIGRRAGLLAMLVAFVAALAGPLASAALADPTGAITITAREPVPPSAPKPTGAASSYTINIECSTVVAQDCGTDPVIRIPLNLTSSNGETPPMTGWTYSASSGTAGLLVGQPVVEGNELVIRLDESKFQPGDSRTIELRVTPPNNITPDKTTWSLLPTLETSEIDETAPEPATGEATAKATIAVTKEIADGSSFVIKGNQVVYRIKPTCGSSSSNGNLYLKSGSLVDQLPPGLSFDRVEPATFAPVVTGNATAGQVLTWSFPNATSLPGGCAPGASGPNEILVYANIEDTLVNDEDVLRNEVEFTGLPIGRTGQAGDPSNEPLVEDAARDVKILDDPPEGITGFVSKSGVAPLSYDDAGNLQYIGTYPGNWMPGMVASPSVDDPTSAPGRFTVNVNYGGADGFETELLDPMPCATNPKPTPLDRNFHSLDVLPPTTPADRPQVDGLCSSPAFHPTVVRVSTRGLAAAVTGGWTPKAILTDGSTVDLEHVSGSGDTQYFKVPDGNVTAEDVSAILLERNAGLTGRTLRMDVFGYADASLRAMDTLHNIVSASAYPTDGKDPITGKDDARIVIEDDVPQLGALKSFGSQTTVDDGTTDTVQAPLSLAGRVATTATPLAGDVVLADLLPETMEMVNPPTGPTPVTYQVSDAFGAPSQPVTGQLEYLENYDNSGRHLIRITFPASAFADAGYYRLTPPNGLITIKVPTGANAYVNETRTYVKNSGTDVSSTCAPGSSSKGSEIRSSDKHDLDGDGERANQVSCSFEATLTVPPPVGPAFELYKTVQGNLDTDGPKRSPGVGEASNGGTGVYTLNWKSTGQATLKDPVVYDILPFIGDTGVRNIGTARGSAFQPVFTGITAVPGNVQVQYSTSTNPCRPEVVVAPDCESNWSTTPPTDIGDVRALRFEATGNYATGQGFSVEFGVDVPSDNINVIAWNSAASHATPQDGSTMLPAESPRVGIRAPGPLADPTLTTQVSKAKIVQGASVTDTITIDGSQGATGTIDWKLVGPVAPAADGTCVGVSWSGAADVATGQIALQGDDDYVTDASTLTAFGCYSYVVKVTSDFIENGERSHPAGATNEVVQVAPVTPELSTTVSQATIGAKDTVFDTITLRDNDDASGTLSWKLVGPKPIGSDGTCDAVDWTGAPTVDDGTLPFNGNGDYDTTSTALSGAGCYSYVVEATSAQYSGPVGHPAGAANEVVLVRPATIVTAASSLRIAPGAEITDKVVLTGTGGGAGTLEWKVVGPIRANDQGTCENLDWSGAQTFDSGTIAVNGDGTYVTDPSKPTATGCYSYVQLLNAGSAGGPSLHAAGQPNEMFYVGRPTVETVVSQPAIPTGGTLLDTITVKGTGGGAGQLEWKLYGPVVPGVGDSCLGLSWGGATVVAQGTIPVTGDGVYTTPATLPLLLAGCYGYEVTLDGQDYGGPVVSPAGTPGELSLVTAPVVPQQTAKVSIEKTASHRNVRAGRQITYTLTASNTGAGTAQNVVITDTPRSGMRFVSATPEAGTCGSGFPLSCNVGALAPGQKVSVKVVAVPTVSGAVVNGARVTTDTPNESPADEVVADSRVVVKVPMRISKTAGAKTVRAGRTVRFTVTVRNATKVASGRAQVCDRMPSGLVLVSVKGAKVKRKGGQHCWTVPALKPGQTKRYTVTARALKGAKGTQVNRVTLKGDSVQTKSARASVKVRAVPVRAGGVTG